MRLAIRLFLVLGLVTPTLSAQRLVTPQPSPHARVEETIGITVISVDYHRPTVHGRAIWGGLVPYDVIWHAGANEPTLGIVAVRPPPLREAIEDGGPLWRADDEQA